MSQVPWWKGSRGEWYVVAQVFLFALVAFGPRTMSGLPSWRAPDLAIGSVVGGVMMLAGGVLAGAAVIGLGSNLTALPYPKDDATMVQSGSYRIVRHPIYSGLIIGALGWALWSHAWFTILYALVLFVFFDIKSRREERWLAEKFPGYEGYRHRVKKLIPWLY